MSQDVPAHSGPPGPPGPQGPPGPPRQPAQQAPPGPAGQPGAGPAPGRVLAGRYTLLAEIGRGGMGIVWRADDQVIGRRVAIKELHLATDVPVEERAAYEGRVLREARNAGRLSDPGTVTVYDVLQVGDAVYIVMELVEAPTLAQIVRRSGPMDPRKVADIGRQVLSGLVAAHAAGIVHRDVKPSNIMVLPSGRAKLTDFGIAHALDDPTVTSTGVMMGSPAYMAPERLLGQPAGPASDLWSLGAALFTAVEGHGAYERDSTAATLHAVVHDIPYLTRCQGPLAAAIMGLLVPTPQGRITPAQVRPLFDAAVNMPTQQQIPAQLPQPPRPVVPPGLPPADPHSRTAQRGAPSPRPGGAQPSRRWNPALLWLGAGVLAGACFGVGAFAGNKVSPAASDPASQVKVLTYGTGGQIANFALSAGQCGNGSISPGASLGSGSQVTCASAAHDFDVYGSVTPISAAASADYPSQDALNSYGQHQCWLLANTTQVAAAAAKQSLNYAALVPSQGAWGSPNNDSDSRAVYCVLWSSSGTMTGRIDVTDAATSG
jgi:serine/threonine protein kinase